MRLVAPELLADLCGLSPGLIGLAAAVGTALWLLGWWSHRFWVVLIATVTAGLYGLVEAPVLKAQPLVASLLLALAAGLLALALIRLFAFIVGGIVGVALLQAFAPNFDQLFIAFLASGLLGLVLFRWCVTAVTSFLGSVLVVYSGLIDLNQRGALDAGAYAENSSAVLTGAIATMTLVGFLVQLWFERRRRRQKPENEKPAKKKSKEKEEESHWLFRRGEKKAG